MNSADIGMISMLKQMALWPLL